jgi:hypothetical protein
MYFSLHLFQRSDCFVQSLSAAIGDIVLLCVKEQMLY